MQPNDGEIGTNSRQSSSKSSSSRLERRRFLQLTGLAAVPGVTAGAVSADTETIEDGYGVVEYGAGAYGGITESTGSLSVRTHGVDNRTDTSVVLEGEVYELEGVESATVLFEYRKTESDEWWESSPEDVESTGYFSATVDELDPGTEYEYRAVALAEDIRSTGSVATFTTFTPPAVVTLAPSEITHEEATLEAEINDLGDSSTVQTSFQYRPLGNDKWESTSSNSRTTTGTFSETVTGLEANETYEYRGVAEGEKETRDVGDVVTLTTDGLGLDVSTGVASETTETSAMLSWTLEEVDGASSATVAFEYRVLGADGWLTTGDQEVTEGETATTTVEELEPGTDYEFRAIAILDENRDVGDAVSFETETKTESEPSIKRFVVREDSPPNPHADVHVDWSVQDDAELDQIVIEVTEPDGSVTEHSESVSGTVDSGSTEIRIKHGAGDRLSVELTVWNGGGLHVSEAETLSA